MLGHRFVELVEDCLQRLDRGEDLVAVLADHPDYEDRLKPLLLVAMASRSLPIPIPNQTALRLGKHQMLSAMSQMEEQGTLLNSPKVPAAARVVSRLMHAVRERGLTGPAWNYRLAVVALIMVFGAGLFTLNASASGLSGGLIDFLRSSYTSFIQILGYAPDDAMESDLYLFHFFNGGALSFEEKMASKAILLLDLDDLGSGSSTGQDQDTDPKTPPEEQAAVASGEEGDDQDSLITEGDEVEDDKDKDKDDKDKDKEDKDKDKDKDEDGDDQGDEDGDAQGDEDGDTYPDPDPDLDQDDQGEDED